MAIMVAMMVCAVVVFAAEDHKRYASISREVFLYATLSPRVNEKTKPSYPGGPKLCKTPGSQPLCAQVHSHPDLVTVAFKPSRSTSSKRTVAGMPCLRKLFAISSPIVGK